MCVIHAIVHSCYVLQAIIWSNVCSIVCWGLYFVEDIYSAQAKGLVVLHYKLVIMTKPRFRLSQYPPHSTLGARLYVDPINPEAWDMIRDRDAGIIKDFPLVIYLREGVQVDLLSDLYK